MKPYLTEKSVRLAAQPKPVFTLGVSTQATAEDIRTYLKHTYQVEMLGVRFLTIAGETTRRKGIKGYRPGVRKALITLKTGQKLPEFEEALKGVEEAEKKVEADAKAAKKTSKR